LATETRLKRKEKTEKKSAETIRVEGETGEKKESFERPST